MAKSTETIGGEVMSQRLWSVKEVAEFLNLKCGSVYHLLSQKRIPCVRLSSRCVRFDPRVIEAWVAQQAEEPEDLHSPRREIASGTEEEEDRQKEGRLATG
jgi:excisionase family DNA binding protein